MLTPNDVLRGRRVRVAVAAAGMLAGIAFAVACSGRSQADSHPSVDNEELRRRSSSSEASGLLGGEEYVGAHVRLRVPRGWRVAESRAEPGAPLATPNEKNVAVRLESPDGDYVAVWFACPGTERGSDYSWTLLPDPSGRGVADISERRTCTAEDLRACLEATRRPNAVVDVSQCDVCSAGNGRLEIIAAYQGKAIFGRHGVCIDMGNVRTEDRGLAVFRQIAKTFRVEGTVELREPEGNQQVP